MKAILVVAILISPSTGTSSTGTSSTKTPSTATSSTCDVTSICNNASGATYLYQNKCYQLDGNSQDNWVNKSLLCNALSTGKPAFYSRAATFVDSSTYLIVMINILRLAYNRPVPNGNVLTPPFGVANYNGPEIWLGAQAPSGGTVLSDYSWMFNSNTSGSQVSLYQNQVSNNTGTAYPICLLTTLPQAYNFDEKYCSTTQPNEKYAMMCEIGCNNDPTASATCSGGNCELNPTCNTGLPALCTNFFSDGQSLVDIISPSLSYNNRCYLLLNRQDSWYGNDNYCSSLVQINYGLPTYGRAAVLNSPQTYSDIMTMVQQLANGQSISNGTSSSSVNITNNAMIWLGAQALLRGSMLSDYCWITQTTYTQAGNHTLGAVVQSAGSKVSSSSTPVIVTAGTWATPTSALCLAVKLSDPYTFYGLPCDDGGYQNYMICEFGCDNSPPNATCPTNTPRATIANCSDPGLCSIATNITKNATCEAGYSCQSNGLNSYYYNYTCYAILNSTASWSAGYANCQATSPLNFYPNVTYGRMAIFYDDDTYGYVMPTLLTYYSNVNQYIWVGAQAQPHPLSNINSKAESDYCWMDNGNTPGPQMSSSSSNIITMPTNDPGSYCIANGLNNYYFGSNCGHSYLVLCEFGCQTAKSSSCLGTANTNCNGGVCNNYIPSLITTLQTTQILTTVQSPSTSTPKTSGTTASSTSPTSSSSSTVMTSSSSSQQSSSTVPLTSSNKSQKRTASQPSTTVTPLTATPSSTTISSSTDTSPTSTSTWSPSSAVASSTSSSIYGTTKSQAASPSQTISPAVYTTSTSLSSSSPSTVTTTPTSLTSPSTLISSSNSIHISTKTTTVLLTTPTPSVIYSASQTSTGSSTGSSTGIITISTSSTSTATPTTQSSSSFFSTNIESNSTSSSSTTTSVSTSFGSSTNSFITTITPSTNTLSTTSVPTTASTSTSISSVTTVLTTAASTSSTPSGSSSMITPIVTTASTSSSSTTTPVTFASTTTPTTTSSMTVSTTPTTAATSTVSTTSTNPAINNTSSNLSSITSSTSNYPNTLTPLTTGSFSTTTSNSILSSSSAPTSAPSTVSTFSSVSPSQTSVAVTNTTSSQMTNTPSTAPTLVTSTTSTSFPSSSTAEKSTSTGGSTSSIFGQSSTKSSSLGYQTTVAVTTKLSTPGGTPSKMPTTARTTATSSTTSVTSPPNLSTSTTLITSPLATTSTSTSSSKQAITSMTTLFPTTVVKTTKLSTSFPPTTKSTITSSATFSSSLSMTNQTTTYISSSTTVVLPTTVTSTTIPSVSTSQGLNATLSSTPLARTTSKAKPTTQYETTSFTVTNPTSSSQGQSTKTSTTAPPTTTTPIISSTSTLPLPTTSSIRPVTSSTNVKTSTSSSTSRSTSITTSASSSSISTYFATQTSKFTILSTPTQPSKAYTSSTTAQATMPTTPDQLTQAQPSSKITVPVSVTTSGAQTPTSILPLTSSSQAKTSPLIIPSNMQSQSLLPTSQSSTAVASQQSSKISTQDQQILTSLATTISVISTKSTNIQTSPTTAQASILTTPSPSKTPPTSKMVSTNKGLISTWSLQNLFLTTTASKTSADASSTPQTTMPKLETSTSTGTSAILSSTTTNTQQATAFPKTSRAPTTPDTSTTHLAIEKTTLQSSPITSFSVISYHMTRIFSTPTSIMQSSVETKATSSDFATSISMSQYLSTISSSEIPKLTQTLPPPPTTPPVYSETVTPDPCAMYSWTNTECSATCGYGTKNMSRNPYFYTIGNMSVGCSTNQTVKCDLPPCSPMQGIEKTISDWMMQLGCSWIMIGLASAIMVFCVFKGRYYLQVIHVNEDISLFLAHLCVLLFSLRNDKKHSQTICKVGSLGLQYFFTVTYTFQCLEAFHILTVLTNVVMGNAHIFGIKTMMAIGWGIPAIITGITGAAFFDKLMSSYSCWVNVESNVFYATVGPIVCLGWPTVIMLEACGHWDEISRSASINSCTVARAGLAFVFAAQFSSWFMAFVATYYQHVALYTVVFGFNIALGVFIFMYHTFANQKVRLLINNFYRKFITKKPAGTTAA